MRIKPFTSFALDALRIGTALGVFLLHIPNTRLAEAYTSNIGHLLVVVFFVLSGFVISATTNTKKTNAARYFALRLSRLWTVAIPCIAIAFMLEILGRRLAPEQYDFFSRGQMLFRYALTPFFLNESWFLSAAPPTIGPAWSLAYEAWYYIIFGVAVFTRKIGMKLALVSLAALIAGPKILLLMPVWFLGVLASKLLRNPEQLIAFRGPILASSVALGAYMLIFQPEWPSSSKLGAPPLYFSGLWISDLIFGVAIMGLILGLDLFWGNVRIPEKLDALIKELANVSFTLYLLHFPLMVFAAGIIPYDKTSPVQIALVLSAIFIVIYFVGRIIEPQRKVVAPKLQAFFSQWQKKNEGLEQVQTTA